MCVSICYICVYMHIWQMKLHDHSIYSNQKGDNNPKAQKVMNG
jgi:hypothetical protein